PGVVMALCFGHSLMFCQVDVEVKDGRGVFISGWDSVMFPNGSDRRLDSW
nr:hypothetical protein [Tanacetum cinerariifolium]